jgi:hypothetical protein
MGTPSFNELINVAGKALAMEDARLEAARLRRERNACLCEVAEPPEYDVGSDGTQPCWKQWDDEHRDDGVVPVRNPKGNWCPTCLRREELHEAFIAAGRLLSSRKGALASACRAFHRCPKDQPLAFIDVERSS